jgi:hypothetical protein
MRLAAVVVAAGSTLAAAAAAPAGEEPAPRRAYSRTISLGAGAC